MRLTNTLTYLSCSLWVQDNVYPEHMFLKPTSNVKSMLTKFKLFQKTTLHDTNLHTYIHT